MRSTRFIFVISCCLFFSINSSFLDTFKGIGSEITNFPLFKGSFYTGMLRSFGAPPTGYVYSFSVYNDSALPVYVGIQEIVSIMGGSFPKAGGWTDHTVEPFTHYDVPTKEYYFEIIIRSSDGNISNHMPYLQHADTLFQQEVIQLQEKDSTKNNYFRSFMGKELSGGAWKHVLKAEYLGFADPSAKGKNADKGISLSSKLSSLAIKNSIGVDYYLGYTSAPKASSMTARSCQMITKIQADSFALYNAPSGTSLRPGTIGLFDVATEKLLQTYDLQPEGFDGKTYTLEIYQDATTELVPSMCMQGLMPGNYDVPAGRIRDISPIKTVFWYDSAAGKTGLLDLPGKLWIISKDAPSQIIIPCTTGAAVEFNLIRPEIGKTLWLYFLYVDSVDEVKSQLYINNFIAGKVGADTVSQYHVQSEHQMKRAENSTTNPEAVVKGPVVTPQASQALLIQAIDGALKMHKGRIQDPASGITGYLLGADVFLPIGIGAGAMHYKLSPSWTNSGNLPTSAVQNVYASTLSSSAPKGMPTPAVVSITGAPVNLVASMPAAAIAKPSVAPAAKSLAQKASNWIKSKVTKASAVTAVTK